MRQEERIALWQLYARLLGNPKTIYCYNDGKVYTKEKARRDALCVAIYNRRYIPGENHRLGLCNAYHITWRAKRFSSPSNLPLLVELLDDESKHID